MKLTGIQINRYMKIAKKILLILIACLLGIWVWKMIFTTNVSYNNITRITNVKEMIRLNTLDIVDEFVYKDTLDETGVVYIVKSKITIGFDLDNLKYSESNGVLEVELPPANNIEIHSLDCRLLDCYNTGYTGDLFGTPDVDAEQWLQIRSNMEKYIRHEILKRGYVEKARENAKNNLAKLFNALKGDVRIIDREPTIDDIELGRIDFQQTENEIAE